MSKKSNINDILYAIGRRDNIHGLELDQHGCTGLQLNNGETLFFEWHEQAEALFIYTVVSRLPDNEAQRALQMQTILTLNCLAYGATFALKPDSSEVLLQQCLPYASINMEQLDKTIDQLIAKSLSYKKSLQTRSPTWPDTLNKTFSHRTLANLI